MRRPDALRIGRVALVAALMLVPAASVRGAADITAMAQLQQTNGRLDKLLKQRRTNEDGAAKQEMKVIVNQLLDYDELAKRSLANHWTEITAAQRDEFVRTLRQLIEKNYIKQLRTNLDYQVIYKGETNTDGGSTVSTVVKIHTKGKSTDTPIDYKMHKVAERWLVYDIITDDVSMVKNYRQQFNRIINNEHFDGLLRKMRNKIQESDGDEGTSRAGGSRSGETRVAGAGPDEGKPAVTQTPGGKPGGAKRLRRR